MQKHGKPFLFFHIFGGFFVVVTIVIFNFVPNDIP